MKNLKTETMKNTHNITSIFRARHNEKLRDYLSRMCNTNKTISDEFAILLTSYVETIDKSERITCTKFHQWCSFIKYKLLVVLALY